MRQKPNIALREVFSDCDHSGLFPSPAGAKVIVSNDRLFFTYGTLGGGSIVRGFDGSRWTASPRLPIHPPYIAVDTRGIIHVAGLHDTHRQSIFYFCSREPNSIEAFTEGELIHPKNYSSIAVDRRDDSLFYFGTGVASDGIAFRRRTVDGRWSPRTFVARGQLIYPGVKISHGVIHLMVGGWDPPAALYEAVYYFRSKDGGQTWQRADGRPVPTPFHYDPNNPELITQLDRVTRTFDEGRPEPDTHCIQLLVDRRGHPHIVYSCVPAFFPQTARQPRAQQVHARHDGRRWRHSLFNSNPEIDLHGAAIAEDPTGRLHCVVGIRLPGQQHAELGYGSSNDHGDHWSAIEQFTTRGNAEGRGYSYVHWAPQLWRGRLWFVCNRPGGGSLMLGELKMGQ